MKTHILKTTVLSLLCVGFFNSCNKDEITVEKNNSTTWEIDKKIIDDDIRTRIGYDPREQQVYFYKSETDIPMFSLSTLTISNENKVNAVLNFTNKVEKEFKASLVYDPTLYESLKEQYPDYELGTKDLVSITQSEITIAPGSRSASFELLTQNRNDFNKKLILPFSLKVMGDDSVKILKGSESFVVKIFPKEITLKINRTYIVRNVHIDAVTGEASFQNPDVSFTITSDKGIPQDISLGLVRDEDAIIAPEGLEGTIKKVSFKNLTEAEISFQLQNAGSIKAKTILPLKVVIYDANGKEYPTKLKTSVHLYPVYVYPKDFLTGSNSAVVPSGRKINGVSGYFGSFLNDGNRAHFERMLDGNESTFGSFSNDQVLFGGDEELRFSFGESKKVKAIRLKIDPSTPTDKITLNVGYESIGTATFNATNDWYVITFKSAIPLTSLTLYDFTRGGRKSNFNIYEVEFYEE
ncbi:DUF1735 domain-containing protein [Capnocytophaga cynodegmi]|uniref:BT-3987-like N-terminal domain-containing protein n=1 Tax=Capnocytophaga cynodegmi TaxID=28189 RepID=A0A0B7GZ43_9FLAO|nr:DUF1735 domain-containing protein [Capnocytophaga cynodegmi]CEN32425.1 conserved exported hypothetical protein [Capnocytophaga cynodegmi]